jgi:HEAT repeat protein
MNDGLAQLLKQIGSTQGALPVDRLAEFSDLDRSQLEVFLAGWQTLPLERRRQLIRTLGEQATEHFELNFDRISTSLMLDEDPQIRAAAIRNLWESEDHHLVEPLVKMVRLDADDAVRMSAAEALGNFVYLGELEELRRQLFEQVEAALLDSARLDEQAEVRRLALISLGYSSHPEVGELIAQAFESVLESDVAAALTAMSRSADSRWEPHVLSRLQDPLPALRLAAVQAAGELELRAATADLIELLQDVRAEIRRAAIWSLGQIGGDAAADALTSLHAQSDDLEESSLLEDALDNLAFTNGTRDMLIFNIEDPDDAEPD